MLRRALLLLLLLPHASDADEKNVLMLGNSYSAGIFPQVKALFENEAPDYRFIVISPGGKTLQYHADSKGTQQRLKSRKWDLLVLQEQSLTPAADKVHTERFHASVAALATDATQHEIPRVVLFQTWGRRDGHPPLQDVYPDFATMNGKLVEQYEIAARNNGLDLAPVGRAFAVVREQDRELFRRLYQKDGSHPAPTAGYLAACVFYGAITGKSPNTITWRGKLNEQTAKLLREAATEALEQTTMDRK